MADGDFSGGDFGGDNFGEGGMDFGGDVGGSTAFGDVNFGDTGGYGDIGGSDLGMGSNFGLGLGGMFGGEALGSVGDAFGYGDLSLGDLSAGIASTPFGEVNLGETASGGFGQMALQALANMAKGKMANALGIPGPILGVISNLAQGNPKGAAASIVGGLMGPFSALDSVLSSIAGVPSLAATVAGKGVGSGVNSNVSSALTGLANIGAGVYGLSQANRMGAGGNRTAAQAAAQAQLDQLVGGGDITKLPGYQAGEQAIMRSMAAQGYLGSGNMMEALRNYGSDFYNQQLASLSRLAGAQPGQLEARAMGTQLRGQALQSLLYGAGRTDWGNLLRQFGALGGGAEVPIPTGDEGE